MSGTVPILSYVGAIDLATTYGSTIYTIFFDSNIPVLGNVLMFEYKIQPANITNPDPDTITLGFIDTENSNQSIGFANQYQICVPSNNNIYNPEVQMNISVRVYYGLIGSSVIETTEWSNTLAVHNSPTQPNIYLSLYDNTQTVNDLFIVLEEDLSVNYDEVNFLAAYYYQDASNSTVWSISDPLQATSITYQDVSYKLLTIDNFGSVLDPNNSLVYTSVYAVYPFSDASDNNYYSVSHISVTNNAGPTNSFSAPYMNDVVYEVYTNRTQIMDLSWYPPIITSIPDVYTVQDYIVEYSTTIDSIDSSWVILGTFDSTILTTTFDVSQYSCGTTLNFRVQAVSTTGIYSLYSDIKSQNIFHYSTAPQNLVITDTSVVNNLVNMTVNFTNPSDIGCGNPATAYFSIIVDNNWVMDVSYNESANSYAVQLQNLSVNYSGIVEVYLNTEDTNNSGSFLAGDSVTAPYAASNIVLDNPVYEMYNPVGSRAQIMDLSWSFTIPSGWSFDPSGAYVVQLNLNGDGFNDVGITNNQYFSYDISYNNQEQCGNNFVFQVIANLVNGSVTHSIISNETDPEYLFKYASAPQNLVITDTSVVNNLVNMTVNFTNPSDIGCGNPATAYFSIIVDNNWVMDVSYNASANSYAVQLQNLSVDYSGIVEVYLNTEDTNNSGSFLAGDSVTTPYAASNIVLDNPVYEMYNPVGSRAQIMDLSWSFTIPSGWSFDPSGAYVVQLNLNGDGFNDVGITNNQYFSYDISYNNQEQCGNNFVFQVIANLVNGSTSYSITSNVTDTEYLFKYASAPQNLVISNTSIVDATHINMTVNFTNPTTNGCGSPDYFVIEVNGVPQETVVPYSALDPSYNITLSNIEADVSGNVVVYLNTEDTNGRGLLAGDSATTPYIAAILTLDNPYYRIYDSSQYQIMDLSWSSTGIGGWTLVNYSVELRLNEESFNPIIPTTNNLYYTYTIPSQQQVCINTFVYRVIATLSNGSTNYVITSNETALLHFFSYASAPIPSVYWASADPSLNTMDVFMKIDMSGVSVGCGDPDGNNFVVNLYGIDSIGNAFVSTITVPYTGASSYNARFNDITLSSDGVIDVYLNTTDTNYSNVYAGATGSTIYVSGIVPIYVDVSYNLPSTVSFNIISQTALAPVAGILYEASPGELGYVNWNTTILNVLQTTSICTVFITLSRGGSDEYIYNVTISDTTLPIPMGIVCSNQVGIGRLLIQPA